MRLRSNRRKAAFLVPGLLLVLGLVAGPDLTGAASPDDFAPGVQSLRDLDVNQLSGTVASRLPSAAELAALGAFTAENPGAVVRWDDFGGSPDVIYGFASAPSTMAPEEAARDFITGNPQLFGVTDGSTLVLDESKSHDALGGHLVRFNQVHAGIPVRHAGIGAVLDGEKRVVAVSGPYYDGIAVDPTPSLSTAAAVAVAQQDLAPAARILSASSWSLLDPFFNALEAQLGVLVTPKPELSIVPTATDFRLAWSFFYYSRNPFGLWQYSVDAHSGEILSRESFVRTQEEPLAETADYFPTSPPITPELQNDGAIVDDNGQEIGTPAGMIRIELRKFDESNRATGAHDVLTGTHAAIQSALPTQTVFPQAPAGTWHFSADNLPIEARPNERDHLAEPANHFDAISQFIYITSLMEYLDYLHKAGDAAHGGFGEGSFPDSFPNESTPLTGTVHIPNVLEDICGDLPPETDPNFVRQLSACDNAFAIPVSTEIEGQQVVVNPTAYGHGWLFNDLAWDFAVPLHEGTHATITPIAGLEGSPEGGALNEGQADLFAYSIGENPSLGAYIVNSFRLRQLLADNGIDPDSFQFIRNADSQIRYSQLGTRNNAFEVHRDGEIYAGAMWDVRQLMHEFQTGGPFKRPNAITGEATDSIPLAKETWERIFLGSMYVLGTMAPDTFVRARDAAIIADAMLYPADSVDPASPGRHRTLIEQVFAARELGANAKAPLGGRQTISTGLTAFTAGQTKPPTPQGVTAVPESTTSTRVSWQPVTGAFAYQVLKREVGSTAKRLFAGVPGREYFDGDQPSQLAGYTHVEYTFGNGATSYVDNGQGLGRSAGLGLASLDFEYVVRALAINANGQVGVSDLSGTAGLSFKLRRVTKAIDTQIANVDFTNGVFSFDQTLTNVGSSNAKINGTIYTPLTFKIVDISEPSVTVANADNGGSGQNGDEAHFAYQPSLAIGETSAPRNLQFNDPQAKLFTFDAVVTGRLEGSTKAANGSQPADGEIDSQAPPETFHFIEEFTGIVPIGTAGLELASGVDFVDVPFVAKPSATGVTGTLSAEGSLGVLPDVDFFLFDSAGNELDNSGNLGPDEQVGGAVVGGETYVYRVTGFANGPTVFHIVSDQLVDDPADAGSGAAGGATEPETVVNLVRFTVDPVTGTATSEIIE